LECILSIVIATWNTRELTADCLRSIYTSADYGVLKDSLEVIVVDNNSSDNTEEEIKAGFPQVRYFKNSHNEGYAPASNRGMKASNGKYVLLLGSDTVIKDNALLECIRFLDAHSEAGAAACRLVFPDGTLQGNCKKFPTLGNGIKTYLSLDSLNKDYDMAWFGYDKVMQVDQPATTFLMIRNDILKEINYFNEQYRILYNDVELCRKIYEHGYKIFFIPSAEVIHYGSYSTKRAPAKLRRIMYEDVYRYYKDTFGLKAVILIPVLFLRFLLVSIFK
jgi:GT2 family glycosyltransferase